MYLPIQPASIFPGIQRPGSFQPFSAMAAKYFDPNRLQYDPDRIYSPDGTLTQPQQVCDFLIRQVYQRPTRATVYQWFGNPCPFMRKGKKLSCSEYTLVMIHHFGVIRGIWEGAKRLLRCNPITVLRGSYEDPVFTEKN